MDMLSRNFSVYAAIPGRFTAAMRFPDHNLQTPLGSVAWIRGGFFSTLARGCVRTKVGSATVLVMPGMISMIDLLLP